MNKKQVYFQLEESVEVNVVVIVAIFFVLYVFHNLILGEIHLPTQDPADACDQHDRSQALERQGDVCEVLGGVPPKPRTNCEPSWELSVTKSSVQPNCLKFSAIHSTSSRKRARECRGKSSLAPSAAPPSANSLSIAAHVA